MGFPGEKGEQGYMGGYGTPGTPGAKGDKGLPGVPGIRVSIFYIIFNLLIYLLLQIYDISWLDAMYLN